MTRKRRYLISAAVLAACVCIVFGVLAMLPASSVNKENFDRIQDGMTQEEVKAILGEPRPYPIAGISFWICDGGAELYIAFDDQKNVKDKLFVPSNETLTDKLRRWLNLPE
jgi:hypothetical protein